MDQVAAWVSKNYSREGWQVEGHGDETMTVSIPYRTRGVHGMVTKLMDTSDGLITDYNLGLAQTGPVIKFVGGTSISRNRKSIASTTTLTDMEKNNSEDESSDNEDNDGNISKNKNNKLANISCGTKVIIALFLWALLILSQTLVNMAFSSTTASNVSGEDPIELNDGSSNSEQAPPSGNWKFFT